MVVYNKMDHLSYHGVPMYVSKNPFLFGLVLSCMIMLILDYIYDLFLL